MINVFKEHDKVPGTSYSGIRGQRVKAMTKPKNVSEVRRFLGMTNHLGKFLPHLAEKTHPLRDLLKKSPTCGPEDLNSNRPLIVSRKN